MTQGFMKITKYGHCCLLIEIDGVRILTDPGNYELADLGADPRQFHNLDAIIISQAHLDHYHLPALKVVLENNPDASVYSTAEVASQMAEAGLPAEILADGKTVTLRGVEIFGIGKQHAEIYRDFNRVENVGVLIGKRFFYPGDAFTLPKVPVEILALPIAGPWMKIKEAIDFALALKPRYVFSVHDGMLKTALPQHKALLHALSPAGIEFHPADLGVAMEF